MEILFFILMTLLQTEEVQTEFSENIEYCQYVYMSWKNPLNEKCDFAEVKKSLFINF